jgi:SAM-dependent methyltransferase
MDRGVSIDRYYIEKFLTRYALDIHGCVLEIADSDYTTRFGDGRVTKSEVLHVHGGNPKATVVDDLASGSHIASNSFDCIILTQTLQFIYELQAALANLHRILKPGGILLATFPGISQISRYDMDRWGEYWRFTTLSAHKLFEQVFPGDRIRVHTYGNVLAANAFLQGLAVEELRLNELDYQDPEYQLLIAVRAAKLENNS